ncbi:uncharacterized protein LOC110715464 [Chenopodium quinoa]|uniref:uncharacterized protein LOC110715464 n=1 Tax=Chenopodium quinoa TaxID=63459 RepID=UPI000B7941CE|nr:uncharacterized protein LOC110715464 [Chenopodium quinoa]
MEPKIESITRKIWKIVSVAIFMIKKGLSKKKLLMDLNFMMKRGKIAGKKALGNLMFHHNTQGGVGGQSNLTNDAREYEFSCSDTPLYRHYFTNKRKNQRHQINDQYYMPYPLTLEDGQNVNLEDFNSVLEMMLRNEEAGGGLSAPSPALPGLGFGRSPTVRQLRITDSPFPVQNVEEDKHVDQAAEDFIKNFYSQLKLQ